MRRKQIDSPKPRELPFQKRLVAVALPLLSEGEIALVQGVRKILEKNGNLEVVVLSGGYEAPLRNLAQTGQLAGAIGEFMSGVWLESLLEQGVRIVRLGEVAGRDRNGIVSLAADTAAMAREALRVLLGGGAESLGYVGPAGAPGSVQLGEAFAAASAELGKEPIRCPAFSGVMLGRFLGSLQRPAGVLCASDHLARLVLAAASGAGLGVPRDLAVIGVGNVRMESLHAGLGISSFELPLGEIGRRAGEAMVALLEGAPLPQSHARGVRAVLHERESSLRSGARTARALAWLRSHPSEAVNAGELARIAGMSRRSFEIAVRAECGCSPGELLRGLRRERAESLLRETSLDIASVGRECGYPDHAVFSAAFKRWTGSPPSAFRERAGRR